MFALETQMSLSVEASAAALFGCCWLPLAVCLQAFGGSHVFQCRFYGFEPHRQTATEQPVAVWIQTRVTTVGAFEV